MPIHASSVISATIQTWDLALYTSLTDKENESYITPNLNITPASAVITTYQPLYQALSDAIVAYIGYNRTSEVQDLFQSSYGYITMNAMYGTDYSVATNIMSSSLYGMGGMISSIINAPVGNYTDYGSTTVALAASALVAAGVGGYAINSVNIDADTISIGNAQTSETASIDGYKSSMVAVVKNQATQLMMQDITPIGSISKQGITQWFFGSGPGDLGYKLLVVKENLNIQLPVYIV